MHRMCNACCPVVLSDFVSHFMSILLTILLAISFYFILLAFLFLHLISVLRVQLPPLRLWQEKGTTRFSSTRIPLCSPCSTE